MQNRRDDVPVGDSDQSIASTEYHSAEETSVDKENIHNEKTKKPRVEVNVKNTSDAEVRVKVSDPKRKEQKPSRRRVTVLVEDVPDEDDETKSIWRNRRPGPGESWMEPIPQ